MIDQKATTRGLQAETFHGNPVVDASVWLDNFRRIAKLNNCSDELQLNAGDCERVVSCAAGNGFELFTAFQERFASGPRDWFLSQQLSARKHAPNEPIDGYIADITHFCKRLKLSDAGRSKTFQEA